MERDLSLDLDLDLRDLVRRLEPLRSSHLFASRSIILSWFACLAPAFNGNAMSIGKLLTICTGDVSVISGEATRDVDTGSTASAPLL